MKKINIELEQPTLTICRSQELIRQNSEAISKALRREREAEARNKEDKP